MSGENKNIKFRKKQNKCIKTKARDRDFEVNPSSVEECGVARG